ncbi:MAG: DUF3791 domain-containing protein [Treponema sp.]|nr:DUF3791 domain-containing protein [Treponema sp.]
MTHPNPSANKISYTVACVSSFASAHKLSKKDAFTYLYNNKAIDFLKEHYEIEHTLSLADAVADMTEICRQNGRTL